MLCCYFIARSSEQIQTVSFRTLLAMPLSWIQREELLAVARPLPRGSRSTPELMLEYNAVVAAASRRATVLPLPFGTRFRNETAVSRLLEQRRRDLLAALDRLEGKAEMDLRLPLPDVAKAEQIAAQIRELCRPADARAEIRFRAEGGAVLQLTHLIDRHQADTYGAGLKPGVEINGPWPPFHFLPSFLRLPVKAERLAEGQGQRDRAAIA